MGRAWEIPFNRACLVGNELRYVQEAVDRGHLSGDGHFTIRCQEILEATLGVPKALLTTSCTHALEMAALLLNVGPEDEVILPSYTFVSTANAFVLQGARPVFADIRPDTLNLDETAVEPLISPRTKAIVPVHYAGVGCEMDEIMTLAGAHSIPVVEDNAHGLLGRYRGKQLGTFGALATLSFHETKNFTCGEGGCLLLNDPSYFDRAEIIREKGTNRGSFFRGEVDKYTWVDVGSSYLPSDLLAAFLCAQLEAQEYVQAQRRRVFEFYAEHLMEWSVEHGVRLPAVPSHCEQPYHMFYMLMPDEGRRRSLIVRLGQRGILSVFHYVPLHLSPMGRTAGFRPGDCPVAEDVSHRLVRLPFYVDLREEDLERIVAEIRAMPL